MNSLPDLPRHWHVARAIVSAAHATGEDPVAVAQGASSRARFYAAAGLKKVFPAATIRNCLRFCGGASKADIRSRAAMRTGWWRPDIVGSVAADIEAELEPRPGPSVEVPRTPVIEPRPIVIPRVSDRARIIDRRPSGPVTHSLMGDPPPGRSALDRRRAQEASR